VLFEPAFSNGNAVWFTNSLSGDAVVSVTVLTSASHVLTQASHVERYSVELDPKTASQLKNLCESFLERPPPRCDPMGFDGVWYHAAHYVSGRGYLMRSFWTPRRDSVERRFVELAEALRDFATSPASLRTEHWWRIQDTADALREAQGMPFFDPKLGEMQPPANVNRVVAPAKGQSEPSRTESN
jgi:hypothetical protein